jgi:hypothetical protein
MKSYTVIHFRSKLDQFFQSEHTQPYIGLYLVTTFILHHTDHHTNCIQFVTFQVLTAIIMRMAIFWDVVPCSVKEIDRLFKHAYYLHHQGNHRPDNESSKPLWNVVKFVPKDMAQRPTGQPPLHSIHWTQSGMITVSQSYVEDTYVAIELACFNSETHSQSAGTVGTETSPL